MTKTKACTIIRDTFDTFSPQLMAEAVCNYFSTDELKAFIEFLKTEGYVNESD